MSILPAAFRDSTPPILVLLLALVSMAFATPGLQAQEPADPETITVYQDCQTFGCDSDLFRTEINFVNWVRDREVADLHVLVTSEETGGGGRLYTVSLLGQEALEGQELELTFASRGDATDDEVRRGLTRTIRMGVLPFLSDRSVAERIAVEYQPGEDRETGGAPGSGVQVEDPWNLWVFTLRLGGFLNGESAVKSQNFNGSLTARRTTEDWKLSLGVNGSRRKSEFDLDDRVVESVVEDWTSNGLAARSLGAHWTAGVRASAGSSTFRNQELALRLAPGIEYNVFPYSETTRRELTLLYSVGANHFDYEEETIFGELEETRFDQTLTAQLDLNQPWGRASLYADGSHYLHDTDRWRATVGGNVEVRVFKGFSFRVGGRYSWIRDQLFLPLGDATDDEILTRQQQLATNFNYFMNFSVSYTFGSIFNNVVNPRFGGGGGAGMIFF